MFWNLAHAVFWGRLHNCTVCLQQSRVGQGEVSCPIMNAPVLKAGQNAGDCYSALKFAVFLFGVDQRPLFFLFSFQNSYKLLIQCPPLSMSPLLSQLSLLCIHTPWFFPPYFSPFLGPSLPPSPLLCFWSPSEALSLSL